MLYVPTYRSHRFSPHPKSRKNGKGKGKQVEVFAIDNDDETEATDDEVSDDEVSDDVVNDDDAGQPVLVPKSCGKRKRTEAETRSPRKLRMQA